MSAEKDAVDVYLAGFDVPNILGEKLSKPDVNLLPWNAQDDSAESGARKLYRDPGRHLAL